MTQFKVTKIVYATINKVCRLKMLKTEHINKE
uniref:Uncharacterized protein n=1 Tax=Rhizophora mucronata TaxID=61149 RepID=A0A2P2PE43_RHIMU